MNKMYKGNSEYYLDRDNKFIIEDYIHKSPFSSFLPGIAGLRGIPMWVFYVNRGQGVCSFGIRDKDNPIMEFIPANKAYEQVEYNGFRTFINIHEAGEKKYYEPFTSLFRGKLRKTKMLISASGLAIEDINAEYGLKTTVEYFTLPNEKLASLVREVTITNISDREKTIEVLDGMPSVIPYGIDNDGMKQISNTLKAWMKVYNLDKGIPFYKLRAGTEDKEAVESISEGHFYLSFSGEDKGKLLKPIADPAIVFGSNTALNYPERFVEEGLTALLQKPQVPSNKIPCGFSGASRRLGAGEKLKLYSLIGHISGVRQLNEVKDRLASVDFIEQKHRESEELIRELTDNIDTKTASRVFDEYCRQTYLDNLLRGGYPLSLVNGKGSRIYYVYSRKHGDLERDYNYFVTEPEYYSSGNGNYRDVNQNRCNDVFFHPEVQAANIKTFVDLIQADGYNPLIITGDKCILNEAIREKAVRHVDESSRARVEKLLSKPFTIGRLYRVIMDESTGLNIGKQEFIDYIIQESEQITEAVHGEGFWADHWVYNLDLIEKYLRVYPDNEKELLFNKIYTYYDNAVLVKKRNDKYALKQDRVMQLAAVELCSEKEKLISERSEFPNMMRSGNGRGEIYKSSLLAKLVVLSANKFSCLDPQGTGVEMEAGKPGWNDALNGLPGMFGSSMAESCELLRLLDFILEACEKYKGEKLELPKEAWILLEGILTNIKELGTHRCWDNIATAREIYRESISLGFGGEEKELYLYELSEIIKRLHGKLEEKLQKALAESEGIYPTYFYNQPLQYEKLHADKEYVRVDDFEQKKMPLFLEGAVKGLKLCKDKAEARNLYDRVKKSKLYDEKLNMYKNCEPLKQLPADFGRITAFTAGWFENETIWLHMEYKYLLEVLNRGLYDEFFSDFEKAAVPFLKPETYGRSILENSSFIASSANPDEAIHGKGFVARLSGATAEFLSIWNTMMAGHKPFGLMEGKLCLKLKPILPHWLFDERDEITFRFLGQTEITYYNPLRKNTYLGTMETGVIRMLYKDCSEMTFQGGTIPEPYSRDVRSGKVEKIHITIHELHH